MKGIIGESDYGHSKWYYEERSARRTIWIWIAVIIYDIAMLIVALELINKIF